MEFKELSGVLCGKNWSLKIIGRVNLPRIRASMVHGGETWVLRKEEGEVLQPGGNGNGSDDVLS